MALTRIREGWGLLRSLLVYWRPGRQAGLRQLYAPFVRGGDLVFDVGAHLGDRTAAFASLGARVVALEPHPRILPWLRRLVGSSEAVTVRPEAVGSTRGTASLGLSLATPSVSSLSEAWRRSVSASNPSFRRVRWERFVDVPVTTLDLLIEAHGQPAFCKIDVEGFEAEVLRGLSHSLDALSVEFVAGGLSVARGCVTRLEELCAYRYNAVSGEERKFLFEEWQTAREVDRWLAEGADGISSGDLYARRADARADRP